jgi:hypothetical protein
MSHLRNIYASRYGFVPDGIAYESDAEAHFLGFGKKDAAKKAARQDKKAKDKLDRIAARGDARTKVAAAGGGLAGLGKGLSGLADKFLGGGGGGESAPDAGGAAAATDMASAGGGSKVMIIGGILLGIAVVVAIVVAVKKKKKAKSE